MSNEGLTEREGRVLEHLQRAQELQVGLAEYARQAGVNVSELYSGKQSLVRKGVVAGRKSRQATEESDAAAGEFVPIQVRAGFRSGLPTCQIRHPSGLVIECSGLPPIAWIAALLGGVNDVLA
jgi:hypothetical protein